MLFGIRAKMMARKKVKEQREAELYGIKKSNFDKYYKERQKAIYREKAKAQREAEIKKVRDQANRQPISKRGGQAVKKAIKDYGKYLKKKKKTKGKRLSPGSFMGGGGGGPQFGLSNPNAFDIKVKR